MNKKKTIVLEKNCPLIIKQQGWKSSANTRVLTVLGTVKGPTLCLLEKHTFSGHRDSRKKLEIKPAIPSSLCQLLKLLMCKEECCRALMCVFSTEREKERVWIWGGRQALGKTEDVKSEQDCTVWENVHFLFLKQEKKKKKITKRCQFRCGIFSLVWNMTSMSLFPSRGPPSIFSCGPLRRGNESSVGATLGSEITARVGRAGVEAGACLFVYRVT